MSAGYERLPCGCVMGTEQVGPDPADRAFVFSVLFVPITTHPKCYHHGTEAQKFYDDNLRRFRKTGDWAEFHVDRDEWERAHIDGDQRV